MNKHASKFLGTLLVLYTFSPSLVFAQAIMNPLGNNKTTIAGLLIGFTNYLLSLVAILALLGAVWAGMRMILSVGNEQGVSEAKKILLWSIAGLIVAGLSYVIVVTVARNFLGVQGV